MNLPKGFRYAAGYAGIRKKQENDLALIVSDQPAATAAVFTRNRVCAAPVKLGKERTVPCLRLRGADGKSVLGEAACGRPPGPR